jgi:peptide deformylase
MKPYKLVSSSHQCLRTPTQEFDFQNPQMDPVVLFERLKATMLENSGVGLAANQCGINLSVFVIGLPAKPDDVLPVFNPRIVGYSDEVLTEEEGCLSFPGIFIPVKRPVNIRARFSNYNGVTITKNLTDFTSKCFQHEYDHLIGINFLSKASSYHVEKAKKQKKKLDKLRKKNLTNYI